ncbi:ABC transporter ATP-binding protein [Paenibacillus thalictri]|uniref:Nickel import system ATP-binding protein NikD n=1 Tax=Paenibacillus thalictri TaxID=2527873 RepID=A0A4Q9DG24_9BACL|nr:ABC transporter ATP-binding protein [Paenibacillus thalictri]TBL69924.1 ABC transporter ATP-binding protein [Paenibacillus thalictri]
MPMLEVVDLSISFTQYAKGLQQKTVQVIQGLDLTVHAGELVAVVGSSGSGKSLLAHAIMGILPDNATMSGSLIFDGKPLNSERQAELRGKEIALVPQSVNYLDPLMKVGAQVRYSVRGADAASEQRKAFERYQLAPSVEQMFPFQLSGGMARRVLVSTATLSGARLIIADEPTPGLNPEVLQETLQQFRELANQGCAVLLITHDIEAALLIADRVAVFYAGTTVEIAAASDFTGDGDHLRHPYSKALWRALPQNGFIPIPGSQPLPNSLPLGCLFSPRCEKATAECFDTRPNMLPIKGGSARCFHVS